MSTNYKNLTLKPLIKVRNKENGIISYLTETAVGRLSVIRRDVYEIFSGRWYYYSEMLPDGTEVGNYIEQTELERSRKTNNV